MRVVLVTGDRNWSDAEVIRRALAKAQLNGTTTLVEATAKQGR